MKLIPLTQGKHAIVDKADYNWLTKIGSWHFDRYAKRVVKGKGVFYMHRLIVPHKNGQHIDHINGNKLDNRRSNLRAISPSENGHNRHVSKNRYRGVSWDKRRNKWKAVIGFQNQRIDIGRFDSEKEAAIAYNTVAKQLFGEYTHLNDVS